MAFYHMNTENPSSSRHAFPPFSVQSDEEQVSIIRKEFVTLTGDPFSAVILNQLLYWSLRVRDFDLYLEEEASGAQESTSSESQESHHYGWIYKTATDLSEETLLGLSKTTMRKYLKLLIDHGWVEERGNTLEKWKKTTEYRVNVRKLQADLMAIGRQLPGGFLKAFSGALDMKHLPQSFKKESSTTKASKLKNQLKSEDSSKTENWSSESKILPLETRILPSKTEILSSEESSLESSFSEKSEEISTSKILPSETRILPSKSKNLSSKTENLPSESRILSSKTEILPSESKILSPKSKILPSYTYTETTTENTPKITNREHTQRTRAREACNKKFFEEVLEIWQTCAPQKGPVHLTEERLLRLHGVLDGHFQKDLSQWKQFCERVSQSSFLMGQGPRKWRVSLDWILAEENLIKVLEGNFDDANGFEQKQVHQRNANRSKEISAVLASIDDPVWRDCCSQLDFDSRNAVSLGDLKAITPAKILEVENDRLVWMGSSDPAVLSRIEELRLKLLSAIQKTFPKVRNIRTRLEEKNSSLQSSLPEASLISANSLLANIPQQKETITQVL